MSKFEEIIAKYIHSRVARPAASAWNIAKTLLQALGIWAVFLFLIPGFLSHWEDSLPLAAYRFSGPLLRVLSIVMFLGIGTFGLTCGVIMVIQGQGTPLPVDCPRKLVIAGPYRYVRNPMAIASFSQGAAVGLYLGSPLVLLYALAGFVFWNLVLHPWEEKDLEERFGEAYQEYCRHVRCWRPRRTPYVDADNKTAA